MTKIRRAAQLAIVTAIGFGPGSASSQAETIPPYAPATFPAYTPSTYAPPANGYGTLTSNAATPQAPYNPAAPPATGGLSPTNPAYGGQLSPDAQRYAAILAAQGGGQPAQPAPVIHYHFANHDPNDPLAVIDPPQKLFNNIPERHY